MSTPTKIDNNGFVIIKPDDNEKIELTMTSTPLGISLYYDLNTAPKNFSLSSSGATWTNGINTYTTPLQKVGALQVAFSSIEEPPSTNVLKINDTLFLDNGSGQTTTLDINALTLDGSGIGGPTNIVSASDMTITDNANVNQSQITADYVQCLVQTTGDISSMNSQGFSTVNSGTSSLDLKTHHLELADTNTNLQAELSIDTNISADPFLRLQNTNGLSNYLYFSELNADTNYNFKLNNNNSFFKILNPMSYNVYTPNDGDFIEKYFPFVLCDNITGLKLYSPSNYLDDNSNPGWSCIISNLSGGPVNIDTGGYQWYDHRSGLQTNPINIAKWATCRITLLFSSVTIGDYVWAVSQF